VSKARWSIVGVLVAAALVFIVWSMTDGRGSKPLSAALIAMHPDSSDAYIYPVCTTDGRTPLKLANVGGEMTLLDPVDDYIADPPVGVTLPGATGARPQAVAALPGQADGPWVAVARRHKDDNDDPQATDRPLVWHGHQRTSGGPSPAAGAVELPVDLFTKESEGADTTIDVAVARLGDLDVAAVAIHQNEKIEDPDVSGFAVCRLDDCRWRPGAVPQNTAPQAVGSTGAGIVALTTSRPSKADIWYADDADLTWRQIGSAPSGATLQFIQDGAGVATLVWKSEGGKIAVQTVRDGKLRTAVPFAELEGEMARVHTALEVDGRWYLGGSRASTARLELP
jgi:hypothetical protein